MAGEKILLMGCGILKKEVNFLIEKNNWPVDAAFFDSMLHSDFGKLSHSLTTGLSRHIEQDVVVFYGACHPLMDRMLDDAHTFRTKGQNCIDMLLGNEIFTNELLQGAFFLLEDWAPRWTHMISKNFGTKNFDIVREIFRIDRKYVLCVKTPCSDDFSADAEEASKLVGLPLKWMDTTLDHLELTLSNAIAKKLKEIACRA